MNRAAVCSLMRFEVHTRFFFFHCKKAKKKRERAETIWKDPAWRRPKKSCRTRAPPCLRICSILIASSTRSHTQQERQVWIDQGHNKCIYKSLQGSCENESGLLLFRLFSLFFSAPSYLVVQLRNCLNIFLIACESTENNNNKPHAALNASSCFR